MPKTMRRSIAYLVIFDLRFGYFSVALDYSVCVCYFFFQQKKHFFITEKSSECLGVKLKRKIWIFFFFIIFHACTRLLSGVNTLTKNLKMQAWNLKMNKNILHLVNLNFCQGCLFVHHSVQWCTKNFHQQQKWNTAYKIYIV